MFFFIIFGLFHKLVPDVEMKQTLGKIAVKKMSRWKSLIKIQSFNGSSTFFAELLTSFFVAVFTFKLIKCRRHLK